MKRLWYFIVIALILYFANRFFPANVRVDNTGWLLLTTVLIWAVSLIVATLFALVMVAGAVFESVTLVLLPIIGIFLSETIAILLLSSWLSGFWVSGFWTAAIISLCISIFSVGDPYESN